MSDGLIRLFEKPKSTSRCRGCEAEIDWYETLTGKRMPMNVGAMPRRSEEHAKTGRVVGYFASEDSHWSTCPARAQFSRSQS